MKLQSILFYLLVALCMSIAKAETSTQNCPCSAIEQWDPVCGTDGKIYGNSGKLSCYNECNNKNIQVAYKGECKPKPTCDCFAIELWKPVCGTDRKTYGNSGKLTCYNKCNNKNVQVAYDGECTKPGTTCDCVATDVLDPVCGTGGITFGNSGVLACFNKCVNAGKIIQVAYKGECGPNGQCACNATDIYKPVCGSDGKTYLNSGYLGCYNQCNNKKIKVLHKGVCSSRI